MPENEGATTDQATTAAPETTSTDTAAETPDPAAEAEKWKALARKHEERAKENAEKAKAHDAYVEAQKSEAQKLSDARQAAEDRAATAESDRARLQAALDHGLSTEDLDLLGTGTAEEIAERAERLAQRLKAVKPEFPDLAQGRGAPGAVKPDINELIRAAKR